MPITLRILPSVSERHGVRTVGGEIIEARSGRNRRKLAVGGHFRGEMEPFFYNPPAVDHERERAGQISHAVRLDLAKLLVMVQLHPSDDGGGMVLGSSQAGVARVLHDGDEVRVRSSHTMVRVEHQESIFPGIARVPTDFTVGQPGDEGRSGGGRNRRCSSAQVRHEHHPLVFLRVEKHGQIEAAIHRKNAPCQRAFRRELLRRGEHMVCTYGQDELPHDLFARSCVGPIGIGGNE